MFFENQNKFVPPKNIWILEKNFEIEIIFKKKRSSSVSIKENVLSFKLCSYLKNSERKEHFECLLKSIVKKIEKTPNIDFDFLEILKNNFFFVKSDKYFLVPKDTNKVTLSKKNILSYPKIALEKKIVAKRVEIAFSKILLRKYKNFLIDYLIDYNLKTYNYKLNKIFIKYVSSKWGHCSFDDSILINLKLINAKKEILEYVLAHELSHIKYKNHSKSFWENVLKFCPNYKVLRKLLKTNPPNLFKKENEA